MNSAEFKTMREAVGLTTGPLAKMAKVDQRTVRYWESGRTKPPEQACKILLDLDAMLNRTKAEAVMLYSEKKPDTVLLLRYRTDKELHKANPDFKGLPVTVHAALLHRLTHHFMSLGVPVSIEYA